MRDAQWPAGAYVAEFGDEHRFRSALRSLREQGYSRIETYTPYAVQGVERELPEPPSLLPPLVFLAGVGGAAIAYWIQWFADAVSYPLNIGGHPAHAAPAFFIPTFEGAVLAAGSTAFVALWVLLRLPRPWHPIFEAPGFERASIDRYWIALDASDHRVDPALTPRALERCHPLRVSMVSST